MWPDMPRPIVGALSGSVKEFEGADTDTTDSPQSVAGAVADEVCKLGRRLVLLGMFEQPNRVGTDQLFGSLDRWKMEGGLPLRANDARCSMIALYDFTHPRHK